MPTDPPQRRSTKQRDAIERAIHDAARPLSAHEILELASTEVGTLSLATVYRTIRLLLDDRDITQVDIPGESVRYEPAGLEHHHHFHCISCDRTIDLEGCPLDVEAIAPKGFDVTKHEITLFGTCDRCTGARDKKKMPRER
ncbi:MAG: transcriptional repressor [Planctomycetota bacterium]